MTKSSQQTTLFLVLLTIFLATAVIALMSIIGYFPNMDTTTKQWMYKGLIAEAAASIFAFWKQLSGNPFSDPPNVDGDDWEYECIRDGETYKHGGTCSIKVKAAKLGWEFHIDGQRHWKAEMIDGQWVTKKFEAVYAWENAWGSFTGEDALRYGYSVKVGEHLIQGYGSAIIKKGKDGKIVLMEGNFFQLPPHDPFYGFQRYKRKGA